MPSVLRTVLLIGALCFFISAKQIIFQNHAAYLDFEGTIQRQQQREEKIRDEENQFHSETRDPRYEVDRWGREYLECRRHHKHQPEQVTRKRCIRTSNNFDPVCVLQITYVMGENENEEKQITGSCGEEPRSTANHCHRKCLLEKESWKWPHANKTTVSHKCCCYSHKCNWDYQTIFQEYTDEEDSEDTP